MRVTIEYCTMWNYEPRATGLAAELETELEDVEIELIPSGGGVFEVVADGTLIHSKKATSRFPDPGEIVAALRAR